MDEDRRPAPHLATRASRGAAVGLGGVVAFQAAPPRLVTVLAWATTVYMGLGVALNLASPSVRERALWAPVTAVLFALALVVVTTTRTGRPGTAPSGEPPT